MPPRPSRVAGRKGQSATVSTSRRPQASRGIWSARDGNLAAKRCLEVGSEGEEAGWPDFDHEVEPDRACARRPPAQARDLVLAGSLAARPERAPRPSLAPEQEASSLERPEPVLDRRGYSALMECLFPTLQGPQGPVSWRFPRYPLLAKAKDGRQDGLAPIWESVVRHVVKALCSLEKTARPHADPDAAILAQDHIRGHSVATLRALVGKDQPDLPRQRLVEL